MCCLPTSRPPPPVRVSTHVTMNALRLTQDISPLFHTSREAHFSIPPLLRAYAKSVTSRTARSVTSPEPICVMISRSKIWQQRHWQNSLHAVGRSWPKVYMAADCTRGRVQCECRVLPQLSVAAANSACHGRAWWVCGTQP